MASMVLKQQLHPRIHCSVSGIF